MYLPEITLAIFTLFSILRLGSFLPQIIRIANDTDGARAIAYSTWCVWAGANASTAAYALINIHGLDAVPGQRGQHDRVCGRHCADILETAPDRLGEQPVVTGILAGEDSVILASYTLRALAGYSTGIETSSPALRSIGILRCASVSDLKNFRLSISST